MKIEPNRLEETGRYNIPNGTFKCSKCGSTLKSFHEWIMGDDSILCVSCYQGMIFPHNARVCAEILE